MFLKYLYVSISKYLAEWINHSVKCGSSVSGRVEVLVLFKYILICNHAWNRKHFFRIHWSIEASLCVLKTIYQSELINHNYRSVILKDAVRTIKLIWSCHINSAEYLFSNKYLDFLTKQVTGIDLQTQSFLLRNFPECYEFIYSVYEHFKS